MRGGVDLRQQYRRPCGSHNLQRLLPSQPDFLWAQPGKGRGHWEAEVTHKGRSESPDVIGGGVSVALWTTVQIAQLNNKCVPEGLRQTAPHTRSLADWVEPYQFWQAWPLCRDLKNPLLSFSGHPSSWSGKTLCVVKLQQGMASCCWSAALQRTIAPCCYATDVEIADTASNLKNVWNIEIGWKWGLWDSWMYYFSFYNHANWNKKS